MNTKLYKNLVALEKGRHSNWCLEGSSGFNFAQNCHAAPIATIEFFMIAKDYPIAFTLTNDKLTPIAILGVRNHENRYIDKQGTWQSNTYIPALIRGYPFKLLRLDNNSLALHIDEDYENLNQENRGDVLFNEHGNTSDFTRKAYSYLDGFQEHIEFTEQFCMVIKSLDILEPLKSSFKTPDGKEGPINTYFTVNKEKLNAIPEAILGGLAKNGYLEPIYFHLNSLTNLNSLIARTRSTKR